MSAEANVYITFILLLVYNNIMEVGNNKRRRFTKEEIEKVVKEVLSKYWLVFKMLEEYDKSRRII